MEQKDSTSQYYNGVNNYQKNFFFQLTQHFFSLHQALLENYKTIQQLF